MTIFKGCGTCRHVDEPSHGTCCSPCMEAYRENGSEPHWEPKLPEKAAPAPQGDPKAIHGASKPSLGLIPSAALIEEAGALELGAAKYGTANWRKDAVEGMTYIHAGLRHMFAWIDGEDIDPESLRSHLGHARACLGIILDAEATGKLIDNRPHKGAASRLITERTKPIPTATEGNLP